MAKPPARARKSKSKTVSELGIQRRATRTRPKVEAAAVETEPERSTPAPRPRPTPARDGERASGPKPRPRSDGRRNDDRPLLRRDRVAARKLEQETEQQKGPGRRGQAAPEEEFTERMERRALSHVGGKVEFRGDDPSLRPGLEHALAVTPDEDAVRAHVHGFHSYPARLHPDTARGLIESMSKPGDVVLDPFSGSGTVLVEAALAGRKAQGVDVNPLSVLLARVKCTKASLELREAILAAANHVAEEADERRVERAGPSQQYSPQDRSWFDIHVLLELDGLRLAIQKLGDPHVRLPLELVFSSVLTKVSRRAGDTARREMNKRLASGFTIRHFVERAEELVERMSEFDYLCQTTPQVRVDEGDARQLKSVKNESCDLVVTSPPYPGVFDYLDHHELRLRWLGMKANHFAQDEIGARRQMGALGDSALLRWRADLSEVLRAVHRVLRPGALAAFVIADSVVARRPLWADELLIELAPKNGFIVRAVASQRRPYFHEPTARAFEARPRKEHVVVLCRDVVPTRSRSRDDAPPRPRSRDEAPVRARSSDDAPRRTPLREVEAPPRKRPREVEAPPPRKRSR